MLDRKRLHALVAVASLSLVLAAAVAFASDQHEDDHAEPGHASPAAEDLHAATDEEHGEDHGGAHAAPHLLNLVSVITSRMVDSEGHKTPTAQFLDQWVDVIFSYIAILMIAIFFIAVNRKLRDRDPDRRQIFAETLVGGLYGMVEQVLGDQARRFVPYLGTLFIFILVNNWLALVPLGHASTSSFANTNIGLGLMTFLYVQFVGIKENGLGGYLYHFAGQPKSKVEWGFSILIFPIELMGELIKPISLSLRLFGNIFGEDTLVAVMVLLGGAIVYSLTGVEWLPGIPLQFPFYFLGLLASTVQALVFTLLATIYFALMLPHHDHEEAEAH